MTKKVKKHTHTTPRVYLNRFATDGLLMAERPGHLAKPIGVPEVAVRKRFYTLTLPDGTSSNEVEDNLAMLEGEVANALREVDREELPLASRTKAVLAEFLGMQMARGVTYRRLRDGHMETKEPWLREQARKAFLKHAPLERAHEADDYAADYDLTWLFNQNATVKAQTETGIILANGLVNMCWAFVRFDEPVLLSSDQPVVCWLGPHQASPWMPERAIEVRVPLSSTQALVASWHDNEDPGLVVAGRMLDALSINHYTARQAAD
jgi:hypothetical protein